MSHIILENISVNFPLDEQKNKSLRSQILKQEFFKNIQTNQVNALKNINMNLEEGVYGVYGPNGSGKTTLLKVLAKIIYPSEGIVKINERITSLTNIQYGFDDDLTGEENIISQLLLDNINIEDKEISKIVYKILTESKLGDYIYLPLKTYSSGMKFRLAFCLAMEKNGKILILDEWISTADKLFNEHVELSLNNKINSSLVTVIASHNLEKLKKFCKKVFYLDNGEFI